MGTNSNEKKKNSPQKEISNSKSTKRTFARMDTNGETDRRKKIWSFDTLIEAMQPSAEELEYRQQKAREPDFLQKYSKLFKCTKCQSSFKPIIVKQEKVPVHPCLGVLMCQKCCDYYDDGEFSLDSDGEDKYCRWCGEGGTIFSCSNCICGFCTACIKRHFKIGYFKQVQKDEDWLCFFCNPKPLWDLRFICSLAIKMSQSSMIDSENVTEENVTSSEETISKKTNENGIETAKTPVKSSKRRKLFKTKTKGLGESQSELKSPTCSSARESQGLSSDDESDSEGSIKRVKYSSTPLGKLFEKMETSSLESKKSNVLDELKKIITLSGNQMEFGIIWTNKMLERLTTSQHVNTNAGLVKECQRMKHFLSLLSTFFLQFSNSVDSVEKTLQKDNGGKVYNDSLKKDQLGYTTILQFLGFIKNQVKLFMEKGISLPDIFEAEMFEDDKIIGIKKKFYAATTSSQGRSKMPVGSHNFKGNYGTEDKEIIQQNKVDELDKIRDDDILELVGNQTMEKEDFGTEDEYEFEAHHSSNITIGELNDFKSTPVRKDDIREILAILENA